MIDKLLTKEVEHRIKIILPHLPPYGEFKLRLPVQGTKIINIDFLNPNDQEEAEKVKRSIDEFKEDQRLFKLDMEVMQYLIFNGFALNRHDAKEKDAVYRELTEEGRKLRKAGSLKKYYRIKSVTPNFFWADFFKLTVTAILGGVLGALLSDRQQPPQPVKVTVEVPKQVFQVVHDTIRIEVDNSPPVKNSQTLQPAPKAKK